MATYLGTHGGKIQTYSTDPTYPNTGEVWYNSTSNTIKMEAVTTAGSWATGGALNQFRDQAAGSGTVTSTLVFGGGPPNQDKTELIIGILLYAGVIVRDPSIVNVAADAIRQEEISETLMSGGISSLEQYQNLMGQVSALGFMEQELTALLNRTENDDD